MAVRATIFARTNRYIITKFTLASVAEVRVALVTLIAFAYAAADVTAMGTLRSQDVSHLALAPR